MQKNTTNDEPIVKNAVSCGVCGSAADRYVNRFQCQANSSHFADLNTGIFSDLTCPGKSSVVVIDDVDDFIRVATKDIMLPWDEREGFKTRTSATKRKTTREARQSRRKAQRLARRINRN